MAEEPYNGLFQKGMKLSKSSPCVAASLNLRNYSQGRNRLLEDRSSPQFRKEIILTEIDLLGGNGHWRQRKANLFFEQKKIDDAQKAAEERERAEQKRLRKLAHEERRKRVREEQDRAAREKEEKLRLAAEQRAEEERQRLERERRLREEEHREWEARQPRICEECQGQGLCPECDGSGQIFSVFLSRTTDKHNFKGVPGRDFGRCPQGCTKCGGCRQNLIGSLQLGSGRCAGCNGKGKVWPEAAFEQTAMSRRTTNANRRASFMGTPRLSSSMLSPVNSAASPMAGRMLA
mmetsp:Transcript_43837/g.93841  ORF Transcript_43837/g.93841 Transcript_43837/m.93841 type:complete len:291 (-) Transcript_43837:17-889(-)